MVAEGLRRRASAFGAAAQSIVPGVYAWAVTVAPVLDVRWDHGLSVRAHGMSAVARLAALCAPIWLAIGPALKRRWHGGGSVLPLWGFVLSCALAWSAAPAALAPLRIDAPRGVAGMLGWALFALALATPALRQEQQEGDRLVEEARLAPRKGLERGDAAYVAGATLLAASLQLVGWRVPTAERALLVRFVGLAAGLAVVGAATDVALARHARRSARSPARRLRSALAPLVALAILGLTGVIFALK